MTKIVKTTFKLQNYVKPKNIKMTNEESDENDKK